MVTIPLRPFLLATLAFACSVLLPAQERAPIYDEAADANQLVEQALAQATRDHKRVLLMYGGNWCGWCHKLDELFRTDAKIRREISYEYIVVHVDVGHGEKHAELSARFGSDHKAHGYPYLTVVAADGTTVTHQDTGELEDGPKHDPAKVLAFLQANAAPRIDACDVLAAAQQGAKESGKLLFVHIGAPWCGWCHRLEDWMAQPEVAELLAKDFIDVKIDQDRMENGLLVATLLRSGRSGGIPWFVFMDAKLQHLADSDGPGGNTGFPVQPDEIAHFVAMLQKARRNLTDDDIATLQRSLQAKADEINAARRR
ncbi:MAG: thioredoxin family protein [Planctomycetes bacterium]|nr:thioredoxin family protein [Planctomycetota bacterium]